MCWKVVACLGHEAWEGVVAVGGRCHREDWMPRLHDAFWIDQIDQQEFGAIWHNDLNPTCSLQVPFT